MDTSNTPENYLTFLTGLLSKFGESSDFITENMSWNIIGLLPFPILTCPSSFITFLLLPSFSVLPISQDWLAQKQSFFDIYAALFHAYISYLIMWCDCYMSQSLISHHVTGYALFHLFFHHCITFWWLAQPVTAFWWLTQPVITFWWCTACSGFTLPHWCLYIYLLMQLFCNNNHLHICKGLLCKFRDSNLAYIIITCLGQG